MNIFEHLKIRLQWSPWRDVLIYKAISRTIKMIGWFIVKVILLAIPVLITFAMFGGGKAGVVMTLIILTYIIHKFSK